MFHTVAKRELWRFSTRVKASSTMANTHQKTLATPVVIEGVGLHSGAPVRVQICPAKGDSGITFRRADVDVRLSVIPAIWSNVVQEPLNTRLQNEDGVSVGTVEHLMAALAGLGIVNAEILVSGPEVPILDGSAAEFVRAFLRAGVVDTDAPVRAIEILDSVRVERDGARAELTPSDRLSISFEIDFEVSSIGRQKASLSMENGQFLRQLADCRTFCMKSDVDKMHAAGLALGGSFENAVVFDGDRVLSPGGLRRVDEPVRHKMLDALGDLAMAGAPIVGAYHGVRAGHALTNALLRKLFATPEAWRFIECEKRVADNLPGASVSLADLRAVA